MGSYHRTQVLLEEWQYVTLKSMAEGEGVSLSGMLRQILTTPSSFSVPAERTPGNCWNRARFRSKRQGS